MAHTLALPENPPVPNLRGTWKGEATIFHLLQPAGTGKVTVDYEEIKGYVIIRQTGSGINVTALWDDDRYTSIMKHLAPATGSDGRGVFVGQYENKAGIMIGVAGVIIYTTAHPNEANLYYVTIENVPQRGLIVLKGRVRQFCDTRHEALALPPRLEAKAQPEVAVSLVALVKAQKGESRSDCLCVVVLCGPLRGQLARFQGPERIGLAQEILSIELLPLASEGVGT